jgi:gluconolactonase
VFKSSLPPRRGCVRAWPLLPRAARTAVLLLALASPSSCSKSSRLGESSAEPESGRSRSDEEPGEDHEHGTDGDEEPGDDAPEDGDSNGDDGSEPDDKGEDMMPDPGSSAPMSCGEDTSSPGETPAGSANGAVDPTGFAPLEAEQFGAPSLIADTFSLAEGPVWDHCTAQLLFTDVNASTIHTLAADGSVGVYFQPTRFANGLAFDGAGRLLMAEMGGGSGGRISRLDRALNLEVLVERDPACNRLNTSDDLALRSDGTLYFSDPVSPHGSYFGFSFTSKPVYRFKPGVGPERLVREAQASLPNGVRLSPDEKYLYVVGYSEGRVLRFDVAADGSLSGSTPFLGGLTNPDSMCVDAAGNLYVGTSQGLRIFRADASPVTLIPISSRSGTTNCAFGGAEGRTLYITAWTSLWRVDDVPIPGNDWERNRDMPCP